MLIGRFQASTLVRCFLLPKIQSINLRDLIIEKKPRDLYTTIYYLLTPKPGNTGGYMHTNKSESVHVHNQGRAYFTLIDPSARPLQIRKLVMGSNEANGEVRQVLVKSGVWKIIELPEEDVKSADKDGENVGCLMSEIVVPGFECVSFFLF
jgi:predicted cupin superfamily sugar epimerase